MIDVLFYQQGKIKKYSHNIITISSSDSFPFFYQQGEVKHILKQMDVAASEANLAVIFSDEQKGASVREPKLRKWGGGG